MSVKLYSSSERSMIYLTALMLAFDTHVSSTFSFLSSASKVRRSAGVSVLFEASTKFPQRLMFPDVTVPGVCNEPLPELPTRFHLESNQQIKERFSSAIF